MKITEKACLKCEETKSIELFHLSAKGRSGRASQCAECLNRKRGLWRNQNIENERRRLRGAYHKARLINKPWAFKPRSKTGGYNNPQKTKAAARLRNTLRSGKIVKPERCERCASVVPKEKLHGHHKDYTRVLEIEWLCYACHGMEHRKDESSKS